MAPGSCWAPAGWSRSASWHQPRRPVHEALDRQRAMPTPPDHAGRFALRTGRPEASARLSGPELELRDALAEGPLALDRLLGSVRQRSALAKLVGYGEAIVAAFSPSDAAHVLGLHGAWDREAARKAAALFGAQRGPGGKPLAADADAMSRETLEALVRTSAERLLDVALGEDGFALDAPSRHPLLQAALAGRRGIAEISARLTLPIIGLGASAPIYYPDVARMLRAEVIVPDHADVANAVGAVVGRVRTEALATISRPNDALFRVHCAGTPTRFPRSGPGPRLRRAGRPGQRPAKGAGQRGGRCGDPTGSRRRLGPGGRARPDPRVALHGRSDRAAGVPGREPINLDWWMAACPFLAIRSEQAAIRGRYFSGKNNSATTSWTGTSGKKESHRWL